MVDRRLAPPGTLYLVKYISKTTESGVVGFKPGTKVKILEEKGDTILVEIGLDQVEVAPENLTNDLDLAVLASRRDAISQGQLSVALQRAYAERQAEQEKLNALIEQQQRETEQRKRAGKGAQTKGAARSPYIYPNRP